MKCPGCGNDIPAGFEFCGHCGKRLTSSDDGFAGDQLPFPPTQQPQFQSRPSLPGVTTPPSPQLQDQQQAASGPDNIARSTATLNPISQPDQLSSQSNPASAAGFYRDSTEAIMMPAPLSSGPLRQSGQLPSQPLYGFPGPTIANHQPFHPDDPYAPTSISHPPVHTRSSAPLPSSHPGYGYANNSQPLYGSPLNQAYHPAAVSRPPQKPPTQNTTPLIISIGLVILIIIIISAAIIYQDNQPKQPLSNGIHVTGMTTPMHATGNQTPITALTPIPTLAPTPVPDAGFIWCGLECTPTGFMDEYPNGWQMSVLMGNTGIQFINPQQPDQLALFKTQDNPTAPADAILMNELQNNYATQPGYQAPNPPNGQDATIDGETWSSASIIYQGSNQQEEQVTAYVTVHQGKVFIVEIQSAQAQFAQVSTAYYNIMIGKFQFT